MSGGTYPWREVGELDVDAGDVGGDTQSGPAFSRRFQLDRTDGTFALVTTYAFATTEIDAETGAEVYNVTGMTEFLVCTDADDPGRTEIWSDCKYDTPLYITPKDHGTAVAESRRMAEAESIEFYHYWEGDPR